LKADAIVVPKSTVPVGTGDTIEYLIGNIRPELDFGVASNPEFLRAGRAVQDFLQPDHVVIGAESDLAAARLTKLYRSIGIEQERILLTDRRSSELIKYAANGFLATKIAHINEMAELCEKVDARIGVVTRGIGLDERIGTRYLQPVPASVDPVSQRMPARSPRWGRIMKRRCGSSKRSWPPMRHASAPWFAR
jgi:UDPglucose 6-dehydrogenase